jgi:hypothetical protein
MWDPDSAAVYALAKRLPPIKYVVPYHVNDYSTTGIVAKDIAINPPKFIILTDSYRYPELMPLVRDNYILVTRIKNADIYLRVVQ